MMSIFGCSGCFKRLFLGQSYNNTPVNLSNISPAVQIDASKIGIDIVVVKQGQRVCGSGGALACAPIAQDKAYFEIKVQSSGKWCVGLATCNYNPQGELGQCGQSWALKDDGSVTHNGEEKHKTSISLDEGDVIGCTYDHVELVFYKNGSPLGIHVDGIKGTVYPAFYVDEGAILDTIFTGFYHAPPSGFHELMIEQDIL